MQELFIPFQLEIEGNTIRNIELYECFATTLYGENLKGRSRFAAYQPDSISKDEWESMLGEDVNNLRHLLVVYDDTKAMIGALREQGYSLTNDESTALTTAALLHDWQEGAEGMQDDMLYSRTEQMEKREMVVLAALVSQLEQSGILPDGFTEYVTQSVIPVISDRTSKLGRIFNAVERVGYMRTGMRAFKVSQSVESTELAGKLQAMGKSVLYNHLAHLVKYSREYKYVHHFLGEISDMISLCMERVPETIFNDFNQEEAGKYGEKSIVARQAWVEFTS